MAIKCVLQRDFDSLQKLTTTIDTSSQNRLPYTIQGFRSPDDKKTVLHFALQTNDEEFVKALLQEISAKSDPDQVHESDTTLLSHFIAKDETDSEAGNKALIRQTVWNIDWRDPDVAREVATFSCHEGCLPSILDLLMENYPKLHGGVTMKELLIERVYQSLENGHIKSAHHLGLIQNTNHSIIYKLFATNEDNCHQIRFLNFYKSSYQTLQNLLLVHSPSFNSKHYAQQWIEIIHIRSVLNIMKFERRKILI